VGIWHFCAALWPDSRKRPSFSNTKQVPEQDAGCTGRGWVDVPDVETSPPAETSGTTHTEQFRPAAEKPLNGSICWWPPTVTTRQRGRRPNWWRHGKKHLVANYQVSDPSVPTRRKNLSRNSAQPGGTLKEVGSARGGRVNTRDCEREGGPS